MVAGDLVLADGTNASEASSHVRDAALLGRSILALFMQKGTFYTLWVLWMHAGLNARTRLSLAEKIDAHAQVLV